MGIDKFEELKSWQEARRLEQIVYRLTKRDGSPSDRGLVWAGPNSRTVERLSG